MQATQTLHNHAFNGQKSELQDQQPVFKLARWSRRSKRLSQAKVEGSLKLLCPVSVVKSRGASQSRGHGMKLQNVELQVTHEVFLSVLFRLNTVARARTPEWPIQMDLNNRFKQMNGIFGALRCCVRHLISHFHPGLLANKQCTASNAQALKQAKTC